MDKKRHFSQEEKHTILMSAKDIGVDKAAEIAGLHDTTGVQLEWPKACFSSWYFPNGKRILITHEGYLSRQLMAQ